MTATIATVSTEFNKFKPALEADFIAHVTKVLNGFLERNPTAASQWKINAWSSDAAILRAFGYRYLTKSATVNGCSRSSDPYDGMDHDAIKKAAVQYAEDQIAKFVVKLNQKLGMLTEVEVKFADIDGFTCTITGDQNGRKVMVDQKRIINVSTKGNLFHQWPALIYVDGKKHSEAAFKKLI